MSAIKSIVKKLSKNLMFIFLMLATVAVTIYTIARAVESDGNVASLGDSAEQQLTTAEIDKIIEDLKVSGNIDNILDKLDEIIQRAKLSGNSALQEYASNMKTYYELQKQLESVKSLIEASKKKNSDIAAVDKQVSKILSVNTIVEDLRGAVSDEALITLESLDEEKLKSLQELLAEIESIFDLSDISAFSVQQRSLLDVMVLGKIVDDSLVDGERLQVAKDALSVAITILKTYEKQNYTTSEYDDLTAGSDAFLKKGKKASMVLPEQVVFLGGYFNMKHPPIMYDGHILLAIDDLYQYIDASVEYMYNNATMVIQSSGKTLEIVSGKNVAYLNDEPQNMPVPVLSFDNMTYMSAESFAEFYDISHKYIASEECLVLYHNLVQLENPSVANQLNKN